MVDGGGYKGVDYLHLKDYLLNLNIVIVCGKTHHFLALSLGHSSRSEQDFLFLALAGTISNLPSH